MYLLDQVKNQITAIIQRALERAVAQGALPAEILDNSGMIALEVPREETHGDWATNLAMISARAARMAPRKIAEILASYMDLTISVCFFTGNF